MNLIQGKQELTEVKQEPIKEMGQELEALQQEPQLL